MKLEELGWDSFFAEHFAPYAEQGYAAGRIFLQHNKIYQLYTGEGEIEAEATGRLRHRAQGNEDLPAVGDWVVISRREDEDRYRIREVLPRKSKFSRKAAGHRVEEQVVAANIDTVFLVMGLDNDFNPRRLERYLIMAWESGARPIVALNKADVSEEAERRVGEVERVAPGVPVLLMSAKLSEGIEVMRQFIGPGQTVALLGSSGVGKSTIVNALIGSDVQRTSAVREGDDRGRHTTTHRELLFLPNGGLIMDTPGMRELQLLPTDKGVRDAFEDIEELAAQCRFTNCRHENEPDCAIRDALSNGALDPERYANYRKVQAEMRQIELKKPTPKQARELREQKERVKRITREFNKTTKR